MVAHELLVPVPWWRGWRRNRLWWLVLLSLHLLHSVGEILNQLHLRCKKLLHVWIHCLVDRWGWCWVLLIRDMCTDHKRHVLTSSWPGVYHLTVRKIIFQIVVLESMHKKITQNEIATCSSVSTDSVDLKELCITFCVIIQWPRIFIRLWWMKLWNYPNWNHLILTSITRDKIQTVQLYQQKFTDSDMLITLCITPRIYIVYHWIFDRKSSSTFLN
jgi:uncharacterized membrane protein